MRIEIFWGWCGVFLFTLLSSANASPEIQDKFRQALLQIEAGKYASAELTLELIAMVEPTQRVILELAKAQFLRGKYSKAKENFLSVKRMGTLPLNVRAKIDFYLQQIEKSEGYIRYQVGLVNDNNPLNFTSSTSVQVGQFDFAITPPDENETIIGLEHSVDFSTGEFGKKRYAASAVVSLSDFEKSYHDRLSFFGNISRPLGNRYLSTASIYLSEQRKNSEKQFTRFGGRVLSRGLPSLADARAQFSVSKTDVERFGYLDSVQNQLDFLFPYSALSTQGWLSFGYLFQRAKERPYSYDGSIFRATSSGRIFTEELGFTANLAVKHSGYKAVDPMFGSNRVDTLYDFHFSLEPSFAQMFGAQAQFGIRIERNQSSIDYYNYEKLSWMISFK